VKVRVQEYSYFVSPFEGQTQGGLPNQTSLVFADLWSNYLGNDALGNSLTTDEVYSLIGGKVNANHISNSLAFSNTCALRLSWALNKSGNPIPFTRNETGSGADGMWYFYRVEALSGYISSMLGAPDIESTDPADFAGQQGIIQFQVSGWTDSTGHFTLWDGTQSAHGEYWSNSYNVRLWKIN